MKIGLVILTLNEIIGVQKIYKNIPQDAVDEVFVVDGGSNDGTIEYFQKEGVVIHVQEKRGRGEAFRLAFEKTKSDAIIFFAPDGNEDPTDIRKFREYLEEGNDFVIATRMVKGARNEEDDSFIRIRKWANNAFNLMANLTWNNSEFVSDSINGFRAITKKAWHQLRLDGEGYTIEYQSTIRAFKLGMRIKEFATREGNRFDDQEGSPSINTGIAFLKLYLKELLLGKDFG